MAQHRHKRDTNARTLPTLPKAALVAAPVAVVATLSAVTMGVLSATPATSTDDNLLASSAGASLSGARALENRDEVVSRSTIRSAARTESRVRRDLAAAKQTRRAVRRADDKLWTAEDLNLWTGPGEGADKLGVLDSREKVLVTGRREAGRAEVVIDGKPRWVTASYLTAEKPEKPEPAGPSLGGSCSNGSSIDAGRASLYDIHRAVCANWPEVTSYGTWRGDGDHGQGRAIDIMVSGATGWAIADFLRANYGSFGIEYIIYSQKIWSVERGGEGWRGMSDRGSTTANHYDHVHVTVY
ncbi:hypothetical protein EXE58_14945 [Nocardioides seonyuensis]|uniref:ARB-07466-like C-terminal domain-containing protein n=1 Tax=Nocardioides seonyuensis TaxID=2518371 RepID=A0A4P7IIQ4_9ACTN|nr:hypothetical protein [Nocardioides seonyuensis]QBX56633.1 hypothetical protein EXE58_14945 [Nocardioides seonyuensis]